jgi:hypothetical protein
LPLPAPGGRGGRAGADRAHGVARGVRAARGGLVQPHGVGARCSRRPGPGVNNSAWQGRSPTATFLETVCWALGGVV